jgi:HEAT repeat protein
MKAANRLIEKISCECSESEEPTLTASADSDEAQMRKIDRLATSDDPTAAALLIEELQSDNEQVVMAAAKALGARKEKSAAISIVEAFMNAHRDFPYCDDVEIACADALRSIVDSTDVDLVPMLSDALECTPTVDTRALKTAWLAITVLAAIGEPSVPTLIRALGDRELRGWATRALVEIGLPARTLLEEAEGHDIPAVRSAVQQILADVTNRAG